MIYPVRAAQYAAAMLFTLLIAQAANAVQVDVGGITYDIQVTAVGTSYDDNSADIMASPWWGSDAVALQFATEYNDATTYAERDFSIGVSFTFFGASDNGSTVYGAYATDDWAPNSGPHISTTNAPNNARFAIATVVPSVPEIDGNALAKALFILFALGAWLDVRRRRLACGDA